MKIQDLSDLGSLIDQLESAVKESKPENISSFQSLASKIKSQFEQIKSNLIPILSDTAPRFQELRSREIRWQETSINHLSFFNNLLIVLGTGFLGFSFNASEISKYHSGHAEWQPTCIFLSLLLMTVSLLLGLLCGFNRLLDFRYTHRITRYRRKLYKAKQIDNDPDRTKTVPTPLLFWFWKAKFYEVADGEYETNPGGVSEKISKLSNLVKRFGRTTRNLLKFQWLFFLFSIISYVLAFKG